MKRQLSILRAGSTLLALALLVGGCATQRKAGPGSAAAPSAELRYAQLTQRVDELEKQVQQLSEVLEPLKAQLAADKRRKALRQRFEQKMQQDQARHTPEQLREAERLYQVANQKWGSPEASASLQTMIQKYPHINRTGCATLYVAQNSQGEDRARYLQACIEKYGDCFYGDGVQVGAYARFLLAEDYRNQGEVQKAEALYHELKTSYPDAVDHGGNLLTEQIRSTNH